MIPRLLTLLTLLLFSLIVIAVKKLFIKIKSEDSEEDYLDPSFNISYKDAENLLGSSVIEEKHIMINEGLEKINSAIQKFENFSGELGQISIKRYEIPDFLKNTTTNSSLGIVKSDLELYISIFDELIKKANNISTISSKFIKNMSNELNDMKKELNRIKSEFEEMTKNLCAPLLLEQLIKDTEENQVQKDEGKNLDELENEIK
jgi:citrate synthase